jgi:hypothetical protein
MMDDGGIPPRRKRHSPIGPRTSTSHRQVASLVERLLGAPAMVASIYPRRRWVVIVLGVGAGLLLYSSAEHISHVYGPPSRYGPAADYVLPISGPHRPADDRFEFDVEIGLDGCQNPVRVIASAMGPGTAVRNWLRSASLVSFGVDDPSARGIRTFISNGILSVHEEGRLFDSGSRGNRRIFEAPDKSLQSPSTVFRSSMRGASARVPPFRPAGVNPVLYWSFTADWLHPRSYGTCYLALPLVIGPGPGAALVQLPRPPQGRYAGNGFASVELADWNFSEGPEGLRTTPLHVLAEDSSPAPAEPEHPQWSCAAWGGDQSACNGGYVALATANATGDMNTALFLRAALFGVVAALVAESLLRFRRPSRRRPGSSRSHSAGLPSEWTWRS